MGRTRILIVEHDASLLGTLAANLASRGHQVQAAATGAEALQRVEPPPDLVLLDRGLPDLDGLGLLDRLARLDPAPTIVMLTGNADVPTVVETMRASAREYLLEPVDLEVVAEVVAEVVTEALDQRSPQTGEELERDPALRAIVGRSPVMHRAKLLLRRIADSPSSTVLITGESGTGKDLAAKAIHACSERAGRPFVNVTCSALPAELLESELFGHERGAFTDAKAGKRGLVEQANEGTLFLDEMGEMEPRLQAKLLRFLEDKTFRRVGGTTELRADVRVIAATNVDLPAAVRARRFREDLYYRLAVLTVELPPLRERVGDVPLLVRHFLALFGEQFGKSLDASPRALEVLEHHRWPGNVRELKNTIERAALLARGEMLDDADFELTPAAARAPRSCAELPPSGVDLRELEFTLVRQALSRCNGNITHAGRLLGLTRDQVRYRVSKFGLEREVHVQRALG